MFDISDPLEMMHADTEIMVEDWMATFGMLDSDPGLWQNLVEEELDEVLEALANLLKESCDLVWVLRGRSIVHQYTHPDEHKFNGADIFADDVVVKTLSMLDVYAPIMGDDFDSETVFMECFREVYRSNMSKVGNDGKPLYREDGKILKGPNYSPADITSIVEKYAKA